MPSITQKKRCLISPDRAFEIVKDFERYPEFLPWCGGARLQSTETSSADQTRFIADLVIKFKVFTEVFTTSVTCDKALRHIDIQYVKGPFKHLQASWNFKPCTENDLEATDIEFTINFSMKMSPLQKIMSLFFEEAMRKMTQAFDHRFRALS